MHPAERAAERGVRCAPSAARVRQRRRAFFGRRTPCSPRGNRQSRALTTGPARCPLRGPRTPDRGATLPLGPTRAPDGHHVSSPADAHPATRSTTAVPARRCHDPHEGDPLRGAAHRLQGCWPAETGAAAVGAAFSASPRAFFSRDRVAPAAAPKPTCRRHNPRGRTPSVGGAFLAGGARPDERGAVESGARPFSRSPRAFVGPTRTPRGNRETHALTENPRAVPIPRALRGSAGPKKLRRPAGRARSTVTARLLQPMHILQHGVRPQFPRGDDTIHAKPHPPSGRAAPC